MKIIPRSVKVSTIVGMGLQIALVGMTSVKLVVANSQTVVGLGDIYNKNIWITLAGLVMLGSFLFHRVTGSILLGIAILTVFTWWIDDSFPVTYMQWPYMQQSVHDLIDFSDLDLVKMLPAIVAFLFIGIVDVSGVVFGMSSLAGITEPSGNIPGSIHAFVGCGIGSVVGACMGSTPVIVYVEVSELKKFMPCKTLMSEGKMLARNS